MGESLRVMDGLGGLWKEWRGISGSWDRVSMGIFEGAAAGAVGPVQHGTDGYSTEHRYLQVFGGVCVHR